MKVVTSLYHIIHFILYIEQQMFHWFIICPPSF